MNSTTMDTLYSASAQALIMAKRVENARRGLEVSQAIAACNWGFSARTANDEMEQVELGRPLPWDEWTVIDQVFPDLRVTQEERRTNAARKRAA